MGLVDGRDVDVLDSLPPEDMEELLLMLIEKRSQMEQGKPS